MGEYGLKEKAWARQSVFIKNVGPTDGSRRSKKNWLHLLIKPYFNQIAPGYPDSRFIP